MFKTTFSKNILTLLVIVAQLIILTGLIASKQFVLTNGVEVRLALEPVDPRDPFRGDYVILNYEISNVEGYAYYTEDMPVVGEEVYIRLSRNSYQNPNRVWSAGDVITKDDYEWKRGNYNDGHVFIKGTVTRSNKKTTEETKEICNNVILDEESRTWISEENCETHTQYDTTPKYEARIEYNIEEKFIPEESGWDLPNFEDAYAVVFINPNNGEAVLDKIMVNGKEWP